MFMIYFRTQFHTFVSNDSLIITMKLNDKYSLYGYRVIISYSINRSVRNVAYCLKTYYYSTLFQDPKLNVATTL
jgi:hypothetical protein